MTRHFQQRTFVASACIALVVSMPIYAVVINPHGLGQVLVYPYYTVNGNNSTLLTLINSSTDTKAVKVRFLEGYNGRLSMEPKMVCSFSVSALAAPLRNVAANSFTSARLSDLMSRPRRPALPSVMPQPVSLVLDANSRSSARPRNGSSSPVCQTNVHAVPLPSRSRIRSA